MIELTRRFGRYGYRQIAALLRDTGWQVNDKRVERLWRREGLKVPMNQPRKGRLWLNVMARVFVYVLSIATMFGHMILCITEPMMAEHSEHSTSWMNTAKNALRSG
jgi:transposase InsO family protein